jgi:hypothetical protein
MKTLLVIVSAWSGLAVAAWLLIHTAKKVVAAHPRWTTPMEASPPEDDLYVDPAGPFGWIREE